MSENCTYLRIINKTRWTITGGYRRTFGSTPKLDPIPPGTPSPDPNKMPQLLVASPEMHKVAKRNVRHGAEGAFALHLEGEGLKTTATTDTTDTTDTDIVFEYACPHGRTNYWRLKQISPFVQVSARFGGGMPPESEQADWGSPIVVNTHEFGIQLTITERPVERLSVLTYNTHLFEGSPADLVLEKLQGLQGWLKSHPGSEAKLRGLVSTLPSNFGIPYDPNKPLWELPLPHVTYKDAERQAELISRLNSLAARPDIVCLQEVWDERQQRMLGEALQTMYPYIYIAPNRGYTGPLGKLIGENVPSISGWEEFGIEALAASARMIPSEWRSTAQDLALKFDELLDDPFMGNLIRGRNLDSVTNSSGLMVASRFPILGEPTFTVYEGATKFDDQMAKKAAFTLRVQVPLRVGGATAPATFDAMLGATHAFTPTPEALQNVALLAKQTFDQPAGTRPDALLLGDLNLGVRCYRNDEGTKVCVPDGQVGKEYTALMEAMSKWGAQEVVEGDHPGNYALYYTDWNGGIKLTELMEKGQLPPDWNPDPNKRDRLDYVFFRPGDASHLKPLGASGVRVFHDWTVKVKNEKQEEVEVEVSDHAPVLVEFAVVPSGTEPSPTGSETERTPQPVS